VGEGQRQLRWDLLDFPRLNYGSNSGAVAAGPQRRCVGGRQRLFATRLGGIYLSQEIEESVRTPPQTHRKVEVLTHPQ